MAGKNRKSLEERGNKLWAGMRIILAEHRQAMWDYDSKREIKQKPHLDQDRLEEMSRVLAEAIQTDTLVAVMSYNPFGNKQQMIFPHRIDPIRRTLIGLDQDREFKLRFPCLMFWKYAWCKPRNAQLHNKIRTHRTISHGKINQR